MSFGSVDAASTGTARASALRHYSGCSLAAVLGLAACGQSERAAGASAAAPAPTSATAPAAPAVTPAVLAEPTASTDRPVTRAAASVAVKTPAAAAPVKSPAKAPAAAPPVVVVRTADAAHGKQLFATCGGCHGSTGSGTMVGPKLTGVAGRSAGSVEGYKYSDALRESGLTWTRGNLAAFIKAPQAKVPGTKMMMSGPQDADDMEDLIAYLETLK